MDEIVVEGTATARKIEDLKARVENPAGYAEIEEVCRAYVGKRAGAPKHGMTKTVCINTTALRVYR